MSHERWPGGTRPWSEAQPSDLSRPAKARGGATILRCTLVLSAALACAAFACKKEETAAPTNPGQAPQGLPAAGSGGPDPTPVAPSALPSHADMARSMDNPHGGAAADNPHGGMPMDGTHGGAAAAGAPVDPTMVLEGTIDVAPALKAKVKPGDILFLKANGVGPDGDLLRPPIAVDRAQVGAAWPIKFKLSGENDVMKAGKFEGKVVVNARIDRDGDAMGGGQPGDIEGNVSATVPAKDLKIILDKEL